MEENNLPVQIETVESPVEDTVVNKSHIHTTVLLLVYKPLVIDVVAVFNKVMFKINFKNKQ